MLLGVVPLKLSRVPDRRSGLASRRRRVTAAAALCPGMRTFQPAHALRGTGMHHVCVVAFGRRVHLRRGFLDQGLHVGARLGHEWTGGVSLPSLHEVRASPHRYNTASSPTTDCGPPGAPGKCSSSRGPHRRRTQHAEASSAFAEILPLFSAPALLILGTVLYGPRCHRSVSARFVSIAVLCGPVRVTLRT